MDITPKTIVFSPPFGQVSATHITLKNNENKNLIYKIKTTAPQLYCVKPNSASIPAGSSLDVAITRQGQEVDTSKPCKDKFLILYTPVTEQMLSETEKISELWAQIEEKSKSAGQKVFEAQKLTVRYDDSPIADRSGSTEPADSTVYHAATSATPEHKPEHVSSATQKVSELDGIPPKSSEIDMGDAKTGPHLANSNLPDGPEPEHAEDLLAKLRKEREQKPESEQEISKEYAEAAAAGAAAAVAAVSKELDEAGIKHKPSSVYENDYNIKQKDIDSAENIGEKTVETESKIINSAPASVAPAAPVKPVTPAPAAPVEPVSYSAYKPVNPVPEAVNGDKGKITINKVDNQPSADGDKGKMTINKVDNQSKTDGDKGKLTVNQVDSQPKIDGDKGKFSINEIKQEASEIAPVQEVSLNVTVILVILAFFVGWKFF